MQGGRQYSGAALRVLNEGGGAAIHLKVVVVEEDIFHPRVAELGRNSARQRVGHKEKAKQVRHAAHFSGYGAPAGPKLASESQGALRTSERGTS